MNRWRAHARALRRAQERRRRQRVLDTLLAGTPSAQNDSEDSEATPEAAYYLALGIWPIVPTASLMALTGSHNGSIFLGSPDEFDYIRECKEDHPVFDDIHDSRQPTSGRFVSRACLTCPVNMICSERLQKELMQS